MSKDMKAPAPKNGKTHAAIARKPHEAKVAMGHLVSALRPFIAQTRALLNKRAETLASKAAFDRKYVSVDLKLGEVSPFDDTLGMVDLQLKALRTEVGMLFGNKSLEITLPYLWSASSTISTGVVSQVTPVSPVTSIDFAACVALFDEFRVTSFVARFLMPGFVTSGGTVTTDMATNALGLAYAPADNTPFSGASATAALAQYQKHRWYAADPSGPQSISTLPRGDLFEFAGKIPEGVLSSFSSGTTPLSYGAGNWQATNSATILPYGYIKPWSLAGTATASVTAINGIVYPHCEFRIRI
jgi:hypothetical protein